MATDLATVHLWPTAQMEAKMKIAICVSKQQWFQGIQLATSAMG